MYKNSTGTASWGPLAKGRVVYLAGAPNSANGRRKVYVYGGAVDFWIPAGYLSYMPAC